MSEARREKAMGVSKYSEEFRRSAVALVVEKGKSVKKVGEELGVHEQTVKDWVQRHNRAQRSESARIQELEREVRQLRRDLSESQETVEILKKTAAILSKR
jgi:transposase